ncbi:MAG TPA: alpha/beta hydrolase [Gemmatales bacterium]|nr:alpha/beta hydrolase [Gemmatales bacterium]
MMPLRITSLALVSIFFIATTLLGQETRPYLMLSFDDKGKLEEQRAWTTFKTELKARPPEHIFFLVHGWRKSKGNADETFTSLAKLLHDQRKENESIAVIGVRWPSLIGETESVTDQRFKTLANAMGAAMASSTTIQEQQVRLKNFLKKPGTRSLASFSLGLILPDDDQIDAMIDQLQESENVEKLLTAFSYYAMKKRAEVVGSTGLAPRLTELQEALPLARVHLVGHSFGCKVCLASIGADSRTDQQIDSMTLIQAAVSDLCFAPTIKELENTPAGAYAEAPRRVKGPIAVTYSRKDKALTIAYLVASQIAGQVGELPGRRMLANSELYGALGANGIVAVPNVPQIVLGKTGTTYALQSGLNSIDANDVILHHGDIRRSEVAWLVWATARCGR